MFYRLLPITIAYINSTVYIYLQYLTTFNNFYPKDCQFDIHVLDCASKIVYKCQPENAKLCSDPSSLSQKTSYNGIESFECSNHLKYQWNNTLSSCLENADQNYSVILLELKPKFSNRTECLSATCNKMSGK